MAVAQRVRQSSLYLSPPGLLLRGRYAPNVTVHVEEHRVVVAEEHLPQLVQSEELLHRRAYGGRNELRNVLQSRIPYEKCNFWLRQRGTGR